MCYCLTGSFLHYVIINFNAALLLSAHFDSLAQDCGNSNVLTEDLPPSCIKLSFFGIPSNLPWVPLSSISTQPPGRPFLWPHWYSLPSHWLRTSCPCVAIATRPLSQRPWQYRSAVRCHPRIRLASRTETSAWWGHHQSALEIITTDGQ